jgi:hypothetical protein
MATTITPAALTVTLTESISLNGTQQGGTNSLTVSSINEVSKRIVSVPLSEITLVNFGTSVAAGQFDESKVRYIRVTNKDDTNFAYLVFKNEYNNEFCVKLDSGQSYIYNGDNDSGVIDTMLANQVPLGFGETTGDCVSGNNNVTSITATNRIIPGLRVSSAAITASGASVGVTTPAYDASDGYQATAHTVVTRHATTGAETASNATGNEDNDQTYAAGFGDLVEITAEADTDVVDLEVFVASI